MLPPALHTGSNSSQPGPECLDPNTALDFVDGLCTPEQLAAIERHVDGCPLCRQLLSELAKDSAGPSGEHVASPEPRASAEERLLEARLERGRSVGRYLLLDRLGVGGMGVVYSAYDPELDRKVALKLLRVGTARTQEGQARMLREAQAMARLQHPNVLAVFDAGTFGEEVFIAMELVEGSTLTEWLARQRRSWREVLSVFLSAGRGLAAAHAGGLVHRDFKPDNVLLSKDGRVRVTDFGLARDVGASEAMALPASGIVVFKDSERLTRTGALLGTPAYMAPEQFLGGAVDARTDQFSFCVALYEALHGERPFTGDTWEALREGVLGHKVAAAPKGVSVPPWLRRVLLRGLSSEPGARFASMEALLTELERAPQAARRRQVAAAVVAVLLGVGAAGYRHVQEKRERCQGAATRFAGIWDAARKQTVSRSFLATKQPYAQDAWATVERTLDGYTEHWTRQWTESCEATWLEERQPQEVFRRREQCLDWRREKVKALTDLLAEASTNEVRESTSLLSELPTLDACTARGVQPAEPPSRQEPAASPEKAALRAQLARIEALSTASKEPEALEQANAVNARAKELGERALEVESLYWQGVLRGGLEETKDSERLLTEAALAAEALGLDELKARAGLELVWLHGVRLHNPEQGWAWGRRVQATIDRLGGAPNLQYQLHNNLGGMLFDQGKYAEATEQFQKAKEVTTATLGEDHPRMAGMWANYGMGLSTLGRYDEATEAIRHALALTVKWRGSHHPRVGSFQLNLVLSLLQQQRVDEAIPLAQEALSIFEQVTGPGSIDAGRAHTFLGQAFLLRKEYPKALEHLGRSLDIYKKLAGEDSVELADPLVGIATADAEQGRPAEALPLLQRALALQERELGPKHLALGDTLLVLGEAQLALGRTGQALASFERILQLQDIEQNALPVLADARFALARLLGVRPEQRERARELAGKAREFYARYAWFASKKTEADTLLASLPPAAR